jgi:hypothetical protein
MLLREQRTPPLSRPNFCLSLCPLLFWLCATATYRHVCIDGQGVARSAYARTHGGLLLAESNTPSSHVRGDWTVHQHAPDRLTPRAGTGGWEPQWGAFSALRCASTFAWISRSWLTCVTSIGGNESTSQWGWSCGLRWRVAGSPRGGARVARVCGARVRR